MRPKIGTTVHFNHFDTGIQKVPAKVVGVWGNLDLDLRVLHPDGREVLLQRVMQGKQIGCWEWPSEQLQDEQGGKTDR